MSARTDLPDDIPVPTDDGACDHLPGRQLPSVALPSTQGRHVDPAALEGTVVLYCYPMTGRPDVPLPEGWDEIPGARGCTPQSCSFRDHHAELRALGARVYGLSTQTSAEQREAADRLNLPFELLSDEQLEFCSAFDLPLFEADGRRLVKRLTLIAEDGRVVKVFYPVFPPGANAEQVLSWLQDREREAVPGHE